jgi:hypothetical protein
MANDNLGKPKNGTRGPPPALNPETAALTQPWKDFVSRGFITKLNVSFSPMGITVECKVQPSLLKTGENAETVIAIGEAKNRIIEAKLWAPKGAKQEKGDGKNKEALPAASLTKRDFEDDNDNNLYTRAIAIAKAIGDQKARGRIGSLNLMMEGVDTFESWWDNSTPREKTRILSDKKHHDELTVEQIVRFGTIFNDKPCPFRGPVPKKEQEEEEEKQAEPIPPSGALVPVSKPKPTPKGKGKA